MAWFRSRYVQLLERENERLLQENRKLLNLIMPRLGYDALDAPPKKELPTATKKHRMSWGQWTVKKAREALSTPREILLPRPDRKEPDGKPV